MAIDNVKIQELHEVVLKCLNVESRLQLTRELYRRLAKRLETKLKYDDLDEEQKMEVQTASRKCSELQMKSNAEKMVVQSNRSFLQDLTSMSNLLVTLHKNMQACEVADASHCDAILGEKKNLQRDLAEWEKVYDSMSRRNESVKKAYGQLLRQKEQEIKQYAKEKQEVEEREAIVKQLKGKLLESQLKLINQDFVPYKTDLEKRLCAMIYEAQTSKFVPKKLMEEMKPIFNELRLRKKYLNKQLEALKKENSDIKKCLHTSKYVDVQKWIEKRGALKRKGSSTDSLSSTKTAKISNTVTVFGEPSRH